MKIEDFVHIHGNLEQLSIAITFGGIPKSIDPAKLKSIEEVQDIIEKIVAWMRIRAVQNTQL